MIEEAKRNSTASDNYFDYTIKLMKENEEILRSNTEKTYREVIDLINNAIDLIGFAVESDNSKKDYIRYSMVLFQYHILMPSSYAIQTNLLIGNLPACFMELRLMLEAMVKCYFADLKYPNQTFFQKKLELLEIELEKENISTSKLMKVLGEKLGLKNNFIALWGKLSKEWVHPKGFVDHIVNQINEKSGAPSWALVIPMNYTEDDLDTIKELYKRLSQFRKLQRKNQL